MASVGDQHRVRSVISLLVVLSLAAPACSSDRDHGTRPSPDDSSSAVPPDRCDVEGESTKPPTTTSVQVALTEYAVTSLPQTVPSGTTEFVAANEGFALHELAIVRFDGDPATIPLNIVGGADETQLPEGAVVGRIRPFGSGRSCRTSFDLPPGSYALICNLVDDASNPHYSRGMYAPFIVT